MMCERGFGDDKRQELLVAPVLPAQHSCPYCAVPIIAFDNVRYYLQHGIAQPMLSEILAVLRVRTNEEMEALLGNLHISITNFFRDPAVWSALRAIIPRLFVGKNRPCVVSTSGQHAGGIT